MADRSPRTPRPRRAPRAATKTPSGEPPAAAPRRIPAAEASETMALAGQMLIATPAIGDERFARSVIFLCLHNENGAMGIVLNRPLPGPDFAELLRQLDVSPTPPVRRIALTAGGPVENARGFVLHTDDWTGENSMRVDPGLALTASLDVLRALAEGGGPEHGVLALGYAGWGPGQLDQELQANAWLLAPPDPSLLFDADHATKWRRALAKLHVDPLLLSPLAGHA